MMDRIIVYTDGSVIDNGSEDSKGGWAIKLIYKGYVKIKSGNKRGYTNNQMEMYAIFKAMQSITDKTVPVTIYSDSQYVVKIFNGEFKARVNEDMWNQLFSEAKKFTEIKFEWVKAHADNRNNNDVDEIAFQEAQKC